MHTITRTQSLNTHEKRMQNKHTRTPSMLSIKKVAMEPNRIPQNKSLAAFLQHFDVYTHAWTYICAQTHVPKYTYTRMQTNTHVHTDIIIAIREVD